MSNYKINHPTESICFTTNRLIIREFRQNDLEALLAYEKQPGMLQFECEIPDGDAAQKYVSDAIQGARQDPRTNYTMAITIPPGDEVIGRISLTSQNPRINEWEIGWAVRMDDWGKGYAPETACQMLEFAFQYLHAHRVVAFCHAGNAKSARVMEKIGMAKEGHLRQTRWIKDSWADVFIYAILDVEFSRDAC